VIDKSGSDRSAPSLKRGTDLIANPVLQVAQREDAQHASAMAAIVEDFQTCNHRLDPLFWRAFGIGQWRQNMVLETPIGVFEDTQRHLLLTLWKVVVQARALEPRACTQPAHRGSGESVPAEHVSYAIQYMLGRCGQGVSRIERVED